jgi:hypothetical protein
VWNQINHLRTPLDDLRIHDADLAKRVRDVAAQLENAGSSRKSSNPDSTLSEKISLEAEASAHIRLAQEWDTLLGEVRAIPSFESFLQPSPCSALLQHLPDSGAIVVINVDDKRCDALALVAGRDEPLLIPLPQFSQEKAQAYRRELVEQLHLGGFRLRTDDEGLVRGSYIAQKRPVRNVLRGVWIYVVKPVLDALAYSVSAL